MTKNNSLLKIKKKLESGFPGSEIQIIDNSQAHAGHSSGGGMHLQVKIIYKEFAGKTLIEQHMMVNDLLKDEIGNEIHALSIQTRIQ